MLIEKEEKLKSEAKKISDDVLMGALFSKYSLLI
jgi:hypothetical protein